MASLAAAPQGAAELLVAPAEGGIVLWSFEKHRVLRAFEAPEAVLSLLWHPEGAEFVAASRTEVAVYNKAASAAVARVPLPGGTAQSVSLLRWTDASGSTATTSGKAASATGARGD